MLPEQIIENISSELGIIHTTESVGGGDINQAAKIEIGSHTYFVKYQSGHYPGLFHAEATGLEILRRTNTIKVPEIVLVGKQFLVLEWLELRSELGDKSQELRVFGELLVQLHQNQAKMYGLASDNFIGTLPQDNKPTLNWIEFYWGRRLKPQLEIARRRQKLTPEVEGLFEKLYDKLPDLIPSDPEPSLLHGDLWAGNMSFLTDGTPVVFDPAVYCGHREVDLAMTELFGGFSQEFYDAYNSEWLLDSEYKDRKSLYQLYPLMVHWNLFGGGYERQVVETVKRYI